MDNSDNLQHICDGGGGEYLNLERGCHMMSKKVFFFPQQKPTTMESDSVRVMVDPTLLIKAVSIVPSIIGPYRMK